MENLKHLPQMDNFPKISVVMPVYNCAEYIREAIESVVQQHYSNLELIVMDGGSDDGTLEILKEYQEDISILESGPDGGQTKALIVGFKKATGEILCWLNGDDLYLPGTLHKVAKEFEASPKLGLVYGDYLVLSEEGKLDAKPKISYDFKICLYSYLMIPQPSSFWRRQVYDDVNGLNHSFSYSFDWDFFLRVGRLALETDFEIRHVHDIYSVFRLRPDSKSVSESHKFNDERDAILTQFKEFNPFRFRKIKKKYYLLKALLRFKKERGFIPVRGDSRKA